MKALKNWQYQDRTGAGVILQIEGKHRLILRVLEHNMIRVTLLKEATYRLNRTWAVAPDADVPWGGGAGTI